MQLHCLIALYVFLFKVFQLGHAQPTLKTYTFKNFVQQFTLDKDIEKIAVSLINYTAFLNTDLGIIDSRHNESRYWINWYRKCTQSRYASLDNNLMTLVLKQNAVIDCGKGNVFCRKKRPELLNKVSVSPTNGMQCSHSKHGFGYTLHHVDRAKVQRENNTKKTYHFIRSFGKVEDVPRLSNLSAYHTNWEILFSCRGKYVLGRSAPNIYFTNNNKETSFIYGFQNASLVYILYTDIGSGGQTETKLARFCGNGSGMVSYSVITIGCKDELHFTASSAYFKQNPVHMTHTENKIQPGILYVNFIDAYGDASVLCSFPLAQIDTCMEEETKKHHDRVPNYNKYPGCLNRDNRLRGTILVEYPEKGTALAVSFQNHPAMAFVGTSKGNLLKFHLHPASESSLLYNVSLQSYITTTGSTSGIRKSISFDRDEEHLYLLLENTVIKLQVRSCSFNQKPKSCLFRHLRSPFGKECKELDFEKSIEPVSVVLISPFNGPLKGGTVIRLIVEFRQFFTLDHEELGHISVTIGGKQCKGRKWTQIPLTEKSWSVECVTAQSIEEFVGPIVVNTVDMASGQFIARASSNTFFSYLEPRLFGIRPGFGPKAGGTIVTLFGKNLNIGFNQTVTLSGLKCEITEKHAEILKCKTSKSQTNHPREGHVTLWIDRNSVKPQPDDDKIYSKTFEYRNDPVIDLIYPTNTTFSGGTKLVVLGRNMDSVMDPQLVVTLTVNGTEYKMIENLSEEYLDGRKLIFVTPSLSFNHLLQKQTGDFPLRAQLSFMFNGLQNEKLCKNGKEIYLDYYPDSVLSNGSSPNNRK